MNFLKNIFKKPQPIIQVQKQLLAHPVVYIENKKRKFGENEYYWKVTTAQGIYLFTDNELEEAGKRARKNLEDL